MFLINALLAVLHMGLAFGKHSTYYLIDDDVCYKSYDDVISDVDYTMSLTSCSVVCATDKCCSFMYDAVSQRCITSSVYARNIRRGGCGWKYMINQRTCDAPGPYTPYVPYTCDHGYSLNSHSGECVEFCETYGSTFGKFENYVMDGFNGNMVSLENSPRLEKECLELCFAIVEFVCRTVEIVHDQMVCRFSNETALSRPTEYIYREEVTLYHRNCA